MAYPNQQNQEKKTPNVNTDLYQFMNRTSSTVPASTMILQMWNSLVCLKIHPAKPESEQTQQSVYDYNKSINIYLRPEVALGIAEKVKERIAKGLSEGKEVHVAYQTSMKGDMLAFALVPVNNSWEIIVTIMKQVNPQNMQAEASISYSFNFMVEVDGMSGIKINEVNVAPIQNEFAFFLAALQHAALGQLGAENHGRKLKDQNFNREVYGLYKAMAENLNVPFYNHSNGANKFNGGQKNTFYNKFGGNSNNGVKPAFDNTTTPESYGAEMQELGSIDDLVSDL